MMSSVPRTDAIMEAAQTIREADALWIGAGAGMGVDSGLPDFRGNQGFWKAYPPFAKRRLSFVDMANPQWFYRDPETAWGFYGHRMQLYRSTIPHEGFSIMRSWGERMKHGSFVFTSNVDGQFQKAGFRDDQIVECHGSIHHLQCLGPCSDSIWSAEDTYIDVDEVSFKAKAPYPLCFHCKMRARPNILMFGDMGWLSDRSAAQEKRFECWKEEVQDRSIVIIECGAGTEIPSVRWESERLAAYPHNTLIRINPREPHVPTGHIGIADGALSVLREIDEALRGL